MCHNPENDCQNFGNNATWWLMKIIKVIKSCRTHRSAGLLLQSYAIYNNNRLPIGFYLIQIDEYCVYGVYRANTHCDTDFSNYLVRLHA